MRCFLSDDSPHVGEQDGLYISLPGVQELHSYPDAYPKALVPNVNTLVVTRMLLHVPLSKPRYELIFGTTPPIIHVDENVNSSHRNTKTSPQLETAVR